MMPWKITRRAVMAWLICFLICASLQVAAAEEPWQGESASTEQLQVTVTDQNGQPLRLVIVIAQQNDKAVAQERTTPSGNAVLRLAPGAYKIRVEKQGFYTTAVAKLEIAA